MRRCVTRTQRTGLLAVATAAIVVAANANQSAYFSQSWGWVALAFLVPTTVLLLLERATVPGRLRIAFVCLLGAYAAWIALSSLWSISTPGTIRELERILVYLAVGLALALVLRRGDSAGVLGGVALGVTLVAAYALATRLFQDKFHTYDDPYTLYRLSAPLGYANALAVLAAIGLLVAIGLMTHARRHLTSCAPAAALPVLATTLYFTFSREAWVALLLAFGIAVALDRSRLLLLWTSLVVAVPTAVCVAYASRLHALTTEDAPSVDAVREGHRLAAVVLGSCVVSALAVLLARAVARRVPVSKRVRQRVDVSLAVLVVAVTVVLVLVAVGPLGGVAGLEARFNAAPKTSADLNKRLFDISGNGRSEQFRVAWHAAKERPLAGNGAGSYEFLWYERRPSSDIVRDAHSLYLETLAELGVVGLALLLAPLLVLLLGGIRARRARFAASGTAAFAAWAIAAGVDWQWEMVGVTLTALLAGGAPLVALERRDGRLLGGRERNLLVVLGVSLSVAAVWSLVGNQALFAARADVDHKEWAAARRDDRRAHALLRWSVEPDLALGDAAAGAGDRAAALSAYRDAVARDPRNWAAWLRLAQVARGAERLHAYARVHELNPRQQRLPGH
jgi:O-Antigen ligase